MRRSLIAAAIVILVATVIVTHERVTDTADVVTVGRETVDIGDHVVAVLESDTRIAYTVGRSVLGGERVVVQQGLGRAIYRVRDGALAVRSAGGTLDVDGAAVVVVDGARFAIAERGTNGVPRVEGLAEDASLLRTLDDVNDGPGGDLLQRLAELERMRADLERERATPVVK